jgi:hypothetical protein
MNPGRPGRKPMETGINAEHAEDAEERREEILCESLRVFAFSALKNFRKLRKLVCRTIKNESDPDTSASIRGLENLTRLPYVWEF